MRLLNLRPDRVIIKAYIRKCRKKPLDHRAVHSISRTFHAFCRSRKPDHRTYKLVLQPCCLRCLSTDTRAPGTSRAACGLLTLITKHFLIHFIYLHIFPRLFPRDSRQPIQAANTVFAVLPISNYPDTPAVPAAAITDKSSCFPVRHRRTMYSEAFRCLYNAVKSSRGSSKVFICLDNCWNQKNAFTICYSARSTLESFAAKISDMQKDVNWNLAYHAYNQPLSDSQFWSGANASMFTSDANTTTFITMRNIQTLTDYVKNRFGSNTRIILSEQGFSSTYGGQANQAAAIALAYYKAACNPMIDAFIIRSYKDEAHEVAQGLAMGLKDANGKKKTAYNVFKNMDSSNSLKYTEKVLKSQVGNWKSLVPGYSTGKISSMYRK